MVLFMQNIKKVSFHALNSGPHFVVLGAIHGNEVCGPRAINKIIKLFESEQIHLTHGTVTFIPICNPKAYKRNEREYERNLNRHLYPKTEINAYEDRIDPILCDTLKTADYLLDLHSYQSDGDAFIFLGGQNSKEEAFARNLGVDHFIYGWAEAFGNSSQTEEQIKAAMGTTEFTRQFGACAVTLECGNHRNENADHIGAQAILNGLSHLEMITGHYAHQKKSNQQHCAKMKKVFYKEAEGEWIKQWKHFDHVKQGEILIKYKDGTTITADEDGFLILPKDFATIGGEWIYFGVESEFPCNN